MNKPIKILLIGAGDIGSRHLQAISTLKNVAEVDVVDFSNEALTLSQQRLSEVPFRNQSIRFNWLSSLSEAKPEGDLCVIATQAQHRLAALKEASELLRYDRFLLEKIVSQSTTIYQDTLSYINSKHIKAWVNCQSRTYNVHTHIKNKLTQGEPIIFNTVGGNLGLATNGIHSADLFLYHDSSSKIHIGQSTINQSAHPSTRGSDVFDLSGSITGYSDIGSQLTISYSDQPLVPEQISILTKNYRCIVDHMTQWAFESTKENKWRWEPIEFNENILISHMSKKFISDILIDDHCALPSMQDCFPAHKFILDSLLPHFNRILDKNIGYCPVT